MRTYIVKLHGNGLREWFDDIGRRHRDDNLPAREWPDGRQEFWLNGTLHRDGNLPAIDWGNGARYYYVNGKLHRDHGPAIIYSNGSKFYYENGEQYFMTETGQKFFTNPMPITN